MREVIATYYELVIMMSSTYINMNMVTPFVNLVRREGLLLVTKNSKLFKVELSF